MDALGHDEIEPAVWARAGRVASDVDVRLLAHVDNTIYWSVHDLVFGAYYEETEEL